MDTGKPARFAVVELLESPGTSKPGSTAGMNGSETDLDGKFKIDAVSPGDYFAVATLDGYLDPMYGVDFDRIDRAADPNGDKQDSDLIEQWKEHMVEISVSAQHTTDVSIQLERAAEITGTVAYDDGAPAVGMRFALYRRNAKEGWLRVGPSSGAGFSLEQKSDARGRFDIVNLPEGEYIVCSLLPADNQASSPQICLGNTFRRRDARTITIAAGDTLNGADIIIPLKAIHSVRGAVVQALTNKQLTAATVRLLYADDREEAIAMDMFFDGSFLLPFVPQGAYILQVTDAKYDETSSTADGNPAVKVHEFATREIPVTVDQDVRDLTIGLVELPPKAPARH